MNHPAHITLDGIPYRLDRKLKPRIADDGGIRCQRCATVLAAWWSYCPSCGTGVEKATLKGLYDEHVR